MRRGRHWKLSKAFHSKKKKLKKKRKKLVEEKLSTNLPSRFIYLVFIKNLKLYTLREKALP